MRVRDYYWCEHCQLRTTVRFCKLCGRDPVFGGKYVDLFDRLFHLELVLRLDLWSISKDEIDRVLERLVACPLCDGEGLIQPPERDIWAECPVCWGAMYKTPTCDDPFDPLAIPGWYDIARPVQFSMYRNRLKNGTR